MGLVGPLLVYIPCCHGRALAGYIGYSTFCVASWCRQGGCVQMANKDLTLQHLESRKYLYTEMAFVAKYKCISY